jgi:hypothetical protein
MIRKPLWRSRVWLALLLSQNIHAQQFCTPDIQSRAGLVLFTSPGWTSFIGCPSPLDTLKGIHAGIGFRRSYLLPELNEQLVGLAIALPGRSILSAGYAQKGFTLFRRSRQALSFSRGFGRSFGARLSAEREALRFGEGYGLWQQWKVRSALFLRLDSRFEVASEIFIPLAGERYPSSDYGRVAFRYRCSRVFDFFTEAALEDSRIIIRAAFHYQPNSGMGISGGVQSQPLSAGLGCLLRVKSLQIHLAAGHQLLPGWTPAAALSTHWNRP